MFVRSLIVNHNRFCEMRRLFISARALGNLRRRLCNTLAWASWGFTACGCVLGDLRMTGLDLPVAASFDLCPGLLLTMLSVFGILGSWTFKLTGRCGIIRTKNKRTSYAIQDQQNLNRRSVSKYHCKNVGGVLTQVYNYLFLWQRRLTRLLFDFV